jgi:hypothetical protein
MKKLLTLPVFAALVLMVVLVSSAPGAPNPVVNSATGSGHRISGGEFRSFSFSARKRADGTSKGQAQVNARSLDALAHIAIDCLAVDGNVAHMSGVITHTSDPTVFLPNEQVHFAVKDNGQGANDPPDRVTGIPPNEPRTCNDALPSSAFNDIIRGNVKVR